MSQEFDASFFLNLRIDFYHETLDSLERIEALLLALESSKSVSELAELKRELHSLKGNALAVGYKSLSEKVHNFESLLLISVSPELINELFKLIDQLKENLQTFAQTMDASELIGWVA